MKHIVWNCKSNRTGTKTEKCHNCSCKGVGKAKGQAY